MPTRDEYANTIKTGAVSLGTGMAMTALVTKFPILSNPILNKLTEWVVDEIVETLVLKTEFGLFFSYIDLRVNKQGQAFFNAVKVRQELGEDATSEERDRAERDQIHAFSELASIRT